MQTRIPLLASLLSGLFLSLSPEARAQSGTLDPALARTLEGTVAATSPLRRTTADPTLGVVVHTRDVAALRRAGVTVEAVFPAFVTARVRASDMGRVAKLPGVSRVAMGEDDYPTNDVAGALVGARALHDGLLGDQSYRGAGAIVCVYDSGIDFRHLDFRSTTDTTKSRILRLYDMTLTATGAETTPQGLPTTYTTGVEYTNAHLNNELDGTPAGFVRSTDTNGHGTHVAGTAASNGGSMTPRQFVGMAPDADIVVVRGGVSSFSTVNTLNGIKYCGEVATLEGKPMVMNMSIGSDSGPHDGQDEKAAAIASVTSTPGRVVVMSAGNSGGSLIHRGGDLAPGDSVELVFSVPAVGTAANSGFTVDIWSKGRNLTLIAVSPDGTRFVRPITGDGIQTHPNGQGNPYLYNWLVTGTDRWDGDLDRELYFTTTSTGTPYTAAGTWRIRIRNDDTQSDTWHAWLADATIGAANSAVTFVGADALYTVGNASPEIISVGSYMHRNYWQGYTGSGWGIYNYTGANRTDLRSAFSAQGPSRDGRTMPDISAPGQAMLSARSRHSNPANSDRLIDGMHVKNQGTSMAAPVVAGSVALLLAADPTLTAAEVKALLLDNATVDAAVGVAPNNEFGAGKLNVYQAMARLVNAASTSTLQTLTYDTTTGVAIQSLPLNNSVLLRFTTPFTGRLRGISFASGSTTPSGGYDVRLWTNNAGVPGMQIGSTINYPATGVIVGSWNFINTNTLTDNLASGTDYFVSVTPVGSNGSFLRDGAVSGTRTYTAPEVTPPAPGESGTMDIGTLTAQASNAYLRPVMVSEAGSLPVELVAFEGVSTGRRAALTWTTASETNNAGWAVETLGSDGATWRELRFVRGAGTSSEARRYAVETADLVPGRHSFRLRQMDLDGTATLSGVVTVEVGIERALTVALAGPNPSREGTAVVFTVPTDGAVRAEVVDLLGRRVATLFAGEATAGRAHRLAIETGAFGAGIYVVRIEHGGRTVQQRIAVAR